MVKFNPDTVRPDQASAVTKTLRSLHWLGSLLASMQNGGVGGRGERIVFLGPNTNTNTIRFQNFVRIRIRILFGFRIVAEYEYEYYSG